MWGVCDKPEIWKAVKPLNERLTVNVLHDVGIQVVRGMSVLLTSLDFLIEEPVKVIPGHFNKVRFQRLFKPRFDSTYAHDFKGNNSYWAG